MDLVKRARIALSVILLAVLGVAMLPSCTAILGIDTDYGDNPCNSSTGKTLPSKECGVGACHRFIDSQDACDPASGLPATCTPDKAAEADTCGDGIDNDCDGSVDENDSGECTCMPVDNKGMQSTKPCFTGSPETRNKGVCHDGSQPCVKTSWGQCTGDVLPTNEICDGLDNNCDGQVDEGCECPKDGDQQSCYDGPPGTIGKGICAQGTQTCKNGKWGKCIGDVVPELEVCDNADHDCDGIPGNGANCTCIDGTKSTDNQPNYPGECYTADPATKGVGACKPGYLVCVNGNWDMSNCVGEVTPAKEQCGGDFNCDGIPDTGGVACLDDGKSCQMDSDCKNKHCVDGVCCNLSCNGTCQACTALKKGGGTDGVCGNIAAGQDPDQECPAGNPTDCKNKGGCDGNGACAKYPQNFQCSSAACEADGVTLDNPKVCDGGGLCVSGGSQTCAPFACDAAKGGCRSSCSGDAECATSGYCNGLVCLTKKIAGSPCMGAKECATGNCVDGVCCDSACSSTCTACTAAKKGSGADGTCGNVAAGTDPNNNCTQDPQNTCGQDGTCNGQGACRLYGNGYDCKAASCNGTMSTPTGLCNGMGTCVVGMPMDCSPYACILGACQQICMGDDNKCSPGAYCDGVNCQGKKGLGASCGGGHECTSGFCIDGVCCNVACGGLCQTCVAANMAPGGINGTCGSIKAGTDPKNECNPDPTNTCKQDGSCNGSGACELYNIQTTCAPAVCAGATTLNNASTCSGLGVCIANGTTDCSPYTCANGACLQVCSVDAQCATGDYCSMATCVPKKPPPQSCGAGNECTTGFCVDGVCCDAACGGACQACTAVKKGGGTDGICGNIAAGADPDNECSDQGAASCGTTGSCSGTGACAKYSAGTTCVPASCNGATLTLARTCDGNGTCQSAMTQSCGNYLCANNACPQTCSDDLQCSPNNYCVAPNCVAKQMIGSPCGNANECLSGLCVDGVCCSTACTGTCLSCNLPGTKGTCTSVPAGQQDPPNCTGANFCTAGGMCQGLKPNGASCLVDGECSSTHCADGVCCGTTCTGTCFSCNVMGSEGTCSQVPLGQQDSPSCTGTNYCSAGMCQPQGANGTPCMTTGECSSGLCVDGVCCNNICNGACKTCNLPGSAGTCSNVPLGGTDGSPVCNGANVCNGNASCLLANGQSCPGGSATCASNFCVDGVCCDTACNGACQACSAAKKGGGSNGTCGNVASGTDPDNDCTDQGAAMCGTNGSCDGSGACAKYPLGTTCAVASCSGTTLNLPDTCNGSGTCLDGGTQSCGFYQCKAAACPVSCGGDADCASTAYCTMSTCTAKKANGLMCGGSNECSSGNCVDGVCCDTACNGACKACNLPATPGVCTNIALGGTDGSPVCSGTNACNGSGSCLLANGQSCPGGSATCASNFCVDGVCCDVACGGTCMACSAAKKGAGASGTCGPIISGTDPDNECTDQGAPSCGTNGNCNGSGACGKYVSGTVCAAASCAGTTLSLADTCNGSGTCVDNGTQSCGLYQCKAGACPNACSVDGDCASTAYCAAPNCVAKKADGQTCSGNNNECVNGNCVDGYCCNSSCTTNCQACNVAGSLGTCSNIPVGGQDTSCLSSNQKYCDGTGTCSNQKNAAASCTAAGECKSGFCVDGVCCGTACPGTCMACNVSGSVGTCSNVVLAEDPGTCDTTNFCDASHACVAKLAGGSACTTPAQCLSGMCSGGMCAP